jgi:hypothetical protein
MVLIFRHVNTFCVGTRKWSGPSPLFSDSNIT